MYPDRAIAVDTVQGVQHLCLRGIVEHHGSSIAAPDNHYVAYVEEHRSINAHDHTTYGTSTTFRNSADSMCDTQWVRVDGDIVEPVSADEALSSEVYIALYQRVLGVDAS